ncbi:hypothetical protein KY309_00570 [Candidatus Woesearchaeota archaeon]|nr:hypothetical protein [Candidatus Woesearchaeota archaeon]MBW3016087.1 hypothetical protein [Candidatus Woesearchaeota archaeon]
MLTLYEWIYGISALTAVFLSIISGIIALSMLKEAKQRKYLAAWRPLIIALVLFAMEEIVGALKIFGIWDVPWLRHVIPSLILVFFIWALIIQINITRGYKE